MQDEKIICKDCGKEFIFTVRDQEFYAEKGFQNKPVRCKECRQAKKDRIEIQENLLMMLEIIKNSYFLRVFLYFIF